MPFLQISNVSFKEIDLLFSSLNALQFRTSFGEMPAPKMLNFSTRSDENFKQVDLQLLGICSQICGLMLSIFEFDKEYRDFSLMYLKSKFNQIKFENRVEPLDNETSERVRELTITGQNLKVMFKERGPRDDRYCDLVVFAL